ncbi:uncharacterized protein LOC100176870 [Ciona intestinalis]
MNLFIIFCFLIGQCVGQSEHAKLVHLDPSFHIKFPKLTPPQLNLSDPRPLGHDLELGMQRPPVGEIAEYFEIPTPRELWDKQVKQYRPAVLRGALNGSPALDKWSDDYLSKNYGDQEVLVEKKYEDRKTEPKRMPIEGFLQQYKQHNWYVVTILPNVMRKDLRVPKPLMCSTFRENMQELNLWIGTHGTRSMLHFDADNIMHCIVSGRKDWILINPDDKPKIDMVMGEPGQGSGFSHLNVDNVDLFENPQLAQVPWEYVSLYAGDCIYLPSQYLHQVRSYNRSVSATYLFYPRDFFDDSDCSDVDLDSYLSLDDVYVYWVYEKGQETVDMGYGNPVNTRGTFEDVITLLNIQHLNLHSFFYMMFFANSDEAVLENTAQMAEFYHTIDTNKDGRLSRDEMFGVNIEQWKDLCRKSDTPHGPTKSEMGDNAEKTNASAAFNPRNNDYYSDAETTKRLVQFIMKEHGYNGVLPYHKFKELVELKSEDHPNSAFIILDTNMDGLLKPDEINKLKLLPFRQVARMGPVYLGDNAEALEEFESIPGFAGKVVTQAMIDSEMEMELKHPMMEVFKQLAEEIKSEPSGWSVEVFTERMKMVYDQPEAKYVDYPFLFSMLDRDNTGMVTMENMDWYVYSEEANTPLRQIAPTEGDEPVVNKERYQPATARRTLVSLVDTMVSVNQRMKYIKYKLAMAKKEKMARGKMDADAQRDEL